MFIKDISFQVEFSAYAEAHFCKDFYKKYSEKQWVETKTTITNTLKLSFGAQQTSLVDVLRFSQEDGVGIFKLDFKVAGTEFSPKSSGNRAIFSVDNTTGRITILLVYAKTHCDKKHPETQWILEHIKANFPEYKKYV